MQILKSIIKSNNIPQNALVILTALITVMFILAMKPLHSIAAIVGILFLVISIFKPWIGVLIIVIILSSIIFENSLPILPVVGGSLHITDILLLALLFIIPFKLTINKNFKFNSTPLDIPLVLFYLAALLSTYFSITHFHTDFTPVIRMFRNVTYYLLFFAITNFVKNKKNIEFVIKGLIGIAALVGMAMIIQAIVGESIPLMPGRVEVAETFGQAYKATRILPPGQTLIFSMFTTLICVITFMHKPLLRSIYFYISLVVGAGLILTYNRNYWVAILFALSIFALLISGKSRRKLTARVAAIIIVAVILFYTFLGIGGRSREIIVSFSDRFTSLFAGRRLFHSASLNWRSKENRYAVEHIKERPIFGIGLGSKYRPGGTWRDDEGTYIHNGYLWILMKTGLIGFLPFMWFYISFLIRGFQNWRQINDAFLKAAFLGFTLSGTGILLAAIVNPLFMEWFAIVIIAVMVGLNESIIRISKMTYSQ